jgi:hypothetical protein
MGMKSAATPKIKKIKMAIVVIAAIALLNFK